MFYTQDDVNAYLKGRGKLYRIISSGRGHGRRANPKGKHGNTMKCHGCNAEYHLVGNCQGREREKVCHPPYCMVAAPLSIPPELILTLCLTKQQEKQSVRTCKYARH